MDDIIKLFHILHFSLLSAWLPTPTIYSHAETRDMRLPACL